MSEVITREVMTELMRLNKRLSQLGICSRREADSWISNGWILVNGKVAQLGQKVSLQDKISVAKTAKQQQAQKVTFILHKPVGYVSAQAEKNYKAAVELINSNTRWNRDRVKQQFNRQQLYGLAPAGRLDIDSTGLLVLTQDGRVAKQIIDQFSNVEKEYLVRVAYHSGGRLITENVQQVFSPEKLALLNYGLELDGRALLPAKVSWQNGEQLKFVLTEGKKRQIRRMCEQVGLKVMGLKRVRIGAVTLGQLPLGQWRYLGATEKFTS